jgi:N-acetylneuraminate epimerase
MTCSCSNVPRDPAVRALQWSQLPPLPDAHGFAAPFAGVSDGALLVAGGANFPNGMPWEGGQKVVYDSVFVLPTPGANWLSGFKLPRPLAYGVSVTTTRGILCAGGSGLKEAFRDAFLLRWDGKHVETQPLPPLPQPMANGCGALVGNTVYLAGGLTGPAATNAMKNFWALDLAAAEPQWRELEPWPGPARIFPVCATQDGNFYLFSGAELAADAQGKPVRRWLKDAYCYQPGKGWKRLSDLPRVAVAAPSPAIEFARQLLVVSGDDGERVNFEPKSAHPGFPTDVLFYDPHTDRWTRGGDSGLSRATVPVVAWRGHAVIPNGEVRPGRRTPEVWQLGLPVPAANSTSP